MKERTTLQRLSAGSELRAAVPSSLPPRRQEWRGECSLAGVRSPGSVSGGVISLDSLAAGVNVIALNNS